MIYVADLPNIDVCNINIVSNELLYRCVMHNVSSAEIINPVIIVWLLIVPVA